MITGPNLITDGLVLYLDGANKKSYPGSGTTWYDLSGNGNNCTLFSGVSFENNALVFDDTYSQYGRVENSTSIQLSTDASFTISYWINFDRITGTYMAPVMKGSFPTSYGHLVGSTNFLLAYTDSDSGAEYTIANVLDADINNWVYITQTYDGSNIRLYRNSTLQGTSGIVSLTTNTLPLYIGANNGTNYFMDGKMATIKIYDKNLTASEIQQNYNATKSRFGLI